MPIYEYKCDDCGRVFEMLQRINSDPIKKCIHCEGSVKKLVSASSFQFKGSGWYVTDYKKSKSVKSESSLDSGINNSKDSKKSSIKGKQKNVA